MNRLLIVAGILALTAGLLTDPGYCESTRNASITFHGAAGCITGSCHLLDTGNNRILLDCGTFMEDGYEEKNRNLPFPGSSIEAVALSHAHLDHSGRLPLLVKSGFSGSIYCAEPTRDILKIMLPIQSMIARGEHRSVPYANYDIDTVIAHTREVEFNRIVHLLDNTELSFHPAQHIIGSSTIRVRYGPARQRHTLVFSGDFGNAGNSILQPRAQILDADVLIIESTYGGRSHANADEQLGKFYRLLQECAQNGGITIIPSFVLARTQKTIGLLFHGMETGDVPASLNVYIDSPSAAAITKIYDQHSDQLSSSLQRDIASGNSPFRSRNLHLHKNFSAIKRPAVIIVPSADASAGKVVTYLKRYIENPDTNICFVSSYQEPGSIGEKIVEGANEIEIDGTRYTVRAQVCELGSFSGHGDQKQIMDWIKQFTHLGRVFVVHGPPSGSRALAAAIREQFDCPVTIPRMGIEYSLETGLPVTER